MLEIAGVQLNPRLVVFDKDGTLIAFAPLWRAWFERMMALLDERISFDPALRDACARTLGYDERTREWDALGPLTIASTGELSVLLAGLLYRYRGTPWSEAVQLVQDTERLTRAGLPVEELVQPIGNVRGLLQRLVDQGITLAVATTDDRDLTLRSLGIVGAADLLAAIVCGDDGVALKPAPDMALALCEQLQIAPSEAIMIGDTVADLDMARAAGFQCAIAVASGAVPGELLAQHTSLVLPDIHAIHILPAEEA